MELDEVGAEEAEAGEPAANLLALAGGRWLGELQPGIGTSYGRRDRVLRIEPHQVNRGTGSVREPNWKI